jgi:hypothetical protein
VRRRLRHVPAGAALAAIGAIGLAVASLWDWFSYDVAAACRGAWTCYSPLPPMPYHGPTDPVTAFDGLGPLAGTALVLAVPAGLLAAALALREVRHRDALLTGALTVGMAAAAIIAVRTVTQPDLGESHHVPNRLVDVTPAAWLGVGFAVIAALGTALVHRQARRSAASPHLS